MTERHKRQLLAIGLLVAIGVPVVLGSWIIASRALDLPLELTCRLAGVSSMTLLATSIVLPLFLGHSRPERQRGFVVLWFVLSVSFNLVWELPRVIFKSALAGAALSRANLPWHIAWWSYTLSDAHYHQVTPFMITVELWWLLASVLAVVGLWRLRRGDDARALLWLGVAGALQAYNASIYVVGNGVIDHYHNVGPGVLAQVLYWGFNSLWTAAATAASVMAFRLALATSPRT
jgi:hypothetical protein